MEGSVVRKASPGFASGLVPMILPLIVTEAIPGRIM
jgi:hypothetical protein